MPRTIARFVALGALLVATAAAPATRATLTSPEPAPPPPPPRAWVAVDADTGAVVDGGNHREPMRVASLIKVLTALVVVDKIEPNAPVEVSTRAEAMPARKLALTAGETWQADHLLHALLLVSANDAAVALAEHAAGSVEEFGALLVETGRRLGFADEPVLQDPAGLDDEFSVGGGNFVSARDLAVAMRAFLLRPELAAIVGLSEYRFVGGDNAPHVLRNHNRMLRLYEGTIGGKTGYTRRSGHCLIAVARRHGRTMIAVVVGAAEPYRSAALLLDRGFSLRPGEGRSSERLPPAVVGAPAPASAAAAVVVDGEEASDDAGASAVGPLGPRDVALLAVGGTPAFVVLARRRRQSRHNATIHPFRI